MYKNMERLVLGNKDELLWKYMSLSKFLYLITQERLYFSRLDKFEDIFESEVPNLNAIGAYDEVRQKKSFKKLSKIIRLITYATCFHINEYESAAMWKLYSENAGIAIQTKIGNLVNAFNEEENDIYIGRVQYIDEQKELAERVDNLGLTFLKRKSFMYENELRCTIVFSDDYICYDHWEKEERMIGYNAKVDLNVLIEKVYISPYAPSFLFDVVNDIIKKYGLNIPVIKSDLYTII